MCTVSSPHASTPRGVYINTLIMPCWVQARKDATPMKATLSTIVDPVGGFKVKHSAYSGDPAGLQAERHFIPPCTLR